VSGAELDGYDFDLDFAADVAADDACDRWLVDRVREAVLEAVAAIHAETSPGVAPPIVWNLNELVEELLDGAEVVHVPDEDGGAETIVTFGVDPARLVRDLQTTYLRHAQIGPRVVRPRARARTSRRVRVPVRRRANAPPRRPAEPERPSARTVARVGRWVR
jgi:hypothetical protein